MGNVEYKLPLTSSTYLFVGKKPIAVLFGEERVDVKSWREVYKVIIKRCNENPANHEMLLYLRNRASGQIRRFISDSPDGMSRPLQIDDKIFCEVHYGSATLMHILTKRILDPAGFDCYGIKLVLKRRDK